MRVEHLAAEALGDDAGADALARGVDRRRPRRPGRRRRRARRTGPWRRSSRPRAAAAPVSSLATICSRRHAALAEQLAVEEHGRHRHDLALLDLVLEQRRRRWRRGVMFGLSTLIRFSACTTSGQFWQDEREVGLEVGSSPSSAADLLERRSASTVGGWPPTCSSASTSEVNSWPSGMPAKRDRDVGAGAVDRERRAARVVVAVAATVIRSDSAAISSSSSRSSADLGLSSSEATSSIGLRELVEVGLAAARLRVASSMAVSFECGGGEDRGGTVSRRCRPRWRDTERDQRVGSDLADEVERRGEGLVALFPLGRADFARVGARRTGRPSPCGAARRRCGRCPRR